jgi:pimeloyl-ACP methyl ester carboxylesterase
MQHSLQIRRILLETCDPLNAYVESGTGHSVHRGGAGEPLVLIHGFSGTRLLWEPVLEALERSHDVLAVNLAGHVGGPELSDTPVSVNALVDAVERDLDGAGFDTAHVVGSSLGGWIAFELATRGRARSVVALAPAGGWEQGSRAERRLRMLFTREHKLSMALLPRIDSLMRRPRLRRALLWQVAAHGERIPPAAAAQMVRDSVACPVYVELMDAILRDGPPRGFDGDHLSSAAGMGHPGPDHPLTALLRAPAKPAPKCRVDRAARTRPPPDVRRPRARGADDRRIRGTRARTGCRRQRAVTSEPHAAERREPALCGAARRQLPWPPSPAYCGSGSRSRSIRSIGSSLPAPSPSCSPGCR